MTRSKWKNFYYDSYILQEVFENSSQQKINKVSSRNMVLDEFFLDKILLVHIGNKNINIKVVMNRLYYTLGSFGMTKQLGSIIHISKKKKNKKKNRWVI